MAQPASPVTAKTGNSRIQQIGQTTGPKWGLSDSLNAHIGTVTETAPLGS